jgi:hypothetical protein
MDIMIGDLACAGIFNPEITQKVHNITKTTLKDLLDIIPIIEKLEDNACQSKTCTVRTWHL